MSTDYRTQWTEFALNQCPEDAMIKIRTAAYPDGLLWVAHGGPDPWGRYLWTNVGSPRWATSAELIFDDGTGRPSIELVAWPFPMEKLTDIAESLQRDEDWAGVKVDSNIPPTPPMADEVLNGLFDAIPTGDWS